MKKHLLLIGFVFLALFATAQNKYTLSGYVRDSLSGETLIGASITISGENKGINSNQYGFYSITLPAGTYPVVVSFVGYQHATIKYYTFFKHGSKLFSPSAIRA